MNKPTSWVEFWALMANTPPTDRLSAGERMLIFESYIALLDAATRGRIEARGLTPPRDHRDALKEYRSIENLDEFTTAWVGFARDLANTTIVPLLDGKQIAPPPTTRTVWRLDAEHRRLETVVTPDTVDKIAVAGSLYDLIGGSYFPWGKCRLCGRIFVRQGRRIYCGPGCTTAAAESARRGSPERKRQMKTARRRQRAREREERDARTSDDTTTPHGAIGPARPSRGTAKAQRPTKG